MNTTTAPAPQLTFRAVLLAIILAMLLAAANTYLGLLRWPHHRLGHSCGGGVDGRTACPGGGHILENNIVQTGASAAASIAAGVIFTIPALRNPRLLERLQVHVGVRDRRPRRHPWACCSQLPLAPR